MLVTMVYGWLYPETREIDIVNTLVIRPVFLCNQGLCIDIKPTGPILGVTETAYEEVRLKMEPGDILFSALMALRKQVLASHLVRSY